MTWAAYCLLICVTAQVLYKLYSTLISLAMHLQLLTGARTSMLLAVTGKVVERDAETVNANLATGEIEVHVTEIEVMNAAKTPPFPIEDGVEVDESLRLKYRYLDLRRPEM